MSSQSSTLAGFSLLREMKDVRSACAALLLGLGCTALAAAASTVRAAEPQCKVIRVASDGKHFVGSNSKTEFHPWGHDVARR